MALQLQPTLSFTKEVFSRSRIYHLSRGLTFDFNATHGTVKGGRSSSVTIPSPGQLKDATSSSPFSYETIARLIEQQTSARLVGVESGSSIEIAFQITHGIVSRSSLSEELLNRLIVLEFQTRKRTLGLSRIDDDAVAIGSEWCAYLHELVRDGKFGPDQLESAITDLTKQGIAIAESFFLFNAKQIAEYMHHAILSACHSFAGMTLQLHELNSRTRELDFWESRPDEPQEILLNAAGVDILSFEYRNAVISCYSALDMLYELFVYLTKKAFGDPRFPQNLHFPDASGRQVFKEGGEPEPTDPPCTVYRMAIPNLEHGYFGALRHARNNLVHNMAAEGLRPGVYLGWALPTVGNLALQYVHFMTRDIAASGKPTTHLWHREFYETKRDAQETLYDWIEQTWQCIFDTIDWLTHRLQGTSRSSSTG